MQIYDNSGKDYPIGKQLLPDFLGFLKYKVDNDKLTLEEAENLLKVFSDGIHLCGTADDFASYYGQSSVNVRSVISRKLLSRPRRAVLYDFRKFSAVIPRRWAIKMLHASSKE